MRLELIPGRPRGARWIWCGLCGYDFPVRENIEHEKDQKHIERLGIWSRQTALDKVIPVHYDDRHYGLFESDAARLGI